MNRTRANVGLLMVVMLLGTAASAWTQEKSVSRTYGTQDETIHRLSAWAFTGFGAVDNAAMQATTKSARYCSATCTFVAPVMLPEGAELASLRFHGCNSHPGFFITVRLLRKPLPIDQDTVAVASNNFAAFPGDGCFTSFFGFGPQEAVIDNFNNAYFIQVALVGGDDRTRFNAVDLFYRIRVSAAPATATFTDVPTNHPFFPFVEALVAAGITTGCNASPPMYCPDDVVTRKQMAKFLSTALGLHFAP